MEILSQPNKPGGFILDDRSKQCLRGAAATAGIAALLTVIGIVLDVVNFLVGLGRPVRAVELEGFGGGFTGGGGFVTEGITIVILGLVNALFAYFLYGFSNTTRSALSNNNQQELTEGLGKMASYFKWLGVIFIIICCISFLAFFAILAGSATA
jgi:hypothetical protein